jgi:hypothetical protein
MVLSKLKSWDRVLLEKLTVIQSGARECDGIP